MEKLQNDQISLSNSSPIKINAQPNTPLTNEKQLIGIFKVRKLAKRGLTSNDRILVVTETTFSYYNIPGKNISTEVFHRTLEKIYNPKRPSSSNAKSEEEEKDFTNLCKEFKSIENLNLFKKEELPYEMCESVYDPDEKDNPKDWKFCVIIRQKNSDGRRNKEPNIYSKINKENGDKISVDKNKIQWVFNLFESNFVERFKKLQEEIRKKKLGNNFKDLAHSKPQEPPKNPPKVVKKEDETQKKEEKKKEENIPENDPEVVQMMYYNEICYQYLLKQYYNVCVHSSPEKQNAQKMKYEFAILQITTKFKEICQTLAKRIVADLYAKPFQQSNPSSYYLFPMVFPYPTKLKKSEQAVFLYYIGGINFTLTWHQTLFKMRNEQKFELEEVQLNGAWNQLNVEFKNRDFFQDLMVRLCKDFPSRMDMPRYPISCIVDYCGFRILCEADIYVDDGGAAVMRKMESNMQNQMNSDPNYSFYKEIASVISNEKVNSHPNNSNTVGPSLGGSISSPNIKGEKDQMNTNAEILIPVSYQNKEMRQQYAKQMYNFQHVIRYHSKQFKDVDSVIFANPEIESIITEKSDNRNTNNINYNNITGYDMMDSSIFFGKDTLIRDRENNTMINLSSNENNTGNLNELHIARGKLNEFFDLTNPSSTNTNIHLKDFKETIKYIMDLKVLIEIKDKFYESGNNSNKKQNLNNNLNDLATSSSMPKRSIYFRPEFVVKYLKENGMLKPNTGNERETDSNDLFLKSLKKYLYLDENGQPHYKNILETYKHFKDNHINYFINCLDTMHFKPYDSETLTETFHRYGVNMFYLGLVAELTSVPHIRELCLIEMISRICKKMIFDMISFKIIRRANEDYYTGSNDHGKNIADYDYTANSSDPYLQYVPVTFFVRYWKDYLKKVHILGSDSFKCTYYEENNKGTTTYSKGLYRRFWHKCTSYADKDIKPIFQTKDEKVGKQNKENNENSMLGEVKKEVVQFLNVLFDFENKHSVRILNLEYNNKSLWDTIFERVKSHYNIDNKEVFAYCDPMYISLPALFSSIQFHAGINVNFSIINNTKYNNKELINKEFSEEMIEIRPKPKVYNYRYFLINRDKFDTIRNDYSILYEESLYKKVLLRYFTEKFQKSVSTYTWGYLHYMNAIRRMDSNQSDSVVEWLCKNDIELKDKIKTELDYYEFFHSQFTSLSFKFECVHYLFLQIIESFANIYREDTNVLMQNTTTGNQSTKNIAISTISTDLGTANDYISEFWFSKHPYLCLLYILIARLNLKTTKHHDEKTEGYFKIALSIAKDSLGVNNIFVANLCEEIGYCYIKSKNYYEGTKHYIMAYNVFKDYKEEFFENFMKILKKITKYFIILGYYKDALEYGSELVTHYIQNMKKAQMIEKFDIEALIFNLILISKSLGDYERGADFCKKLLYDLQQGGKPDPKFVVNRFRDWRYCQGIVKKKEKNKNAIIMSENTNELDKYGVKNIFQIVKIYLKMIIRNLKDTERFVYIQALVKLIENKSEKEALMKMSNDTEILFDTFFNQIKDEGEFGRYFSKMLFMIGAKFEQDKGYQKVNESTSTEIDKNFNEMWNKFRTLFKIFQKNKVFTSFIDTDIYSHFTK